jgi:hypothetical protein
MKKKYTVIFRLVILPVISLLFLLYFSGCGEDPEEDQSIGEITIYNIPEQIPVFGNEDVTAPVFKIYLNASDYQSEDKPPAAKGVAKISEGTLENGKYSVTIKLQKPNSEDQDDPNEDTGLWAGTANYFSLMISPADVTEYGVNAVWIKGGTTLNKGKSECNWESASLINFRALMELDDDPMEAGKKTQALYDDIILKDDDIKN